MVNPYEAVRRLVQAQIDSINAVRAMHHPELDIDDPTTNQDIHKALLSDALSMSVAILARLDVINDPANDQCQASARELAKLIANRLEINLSEKLGIDL